MIYILFSKNRGHLSEGDLNLTVYKFFKLFLYFLHFIYKDIKMSTLNQLSVKFYNLINTYCYD